MKIVGKSTRFHERTKLKIPLQVCYKENPEEEWSNETLTEEVTICGVGFTLSRPVELNRLVFLKMTMPRKFRLFDHVQDTYNVWAVICNIQMLEPQPEEDFRLMIGSALIGKTPPLSFLQNPQTLYDLKPILRNQSLWDARELPRKTGRYMRSTEERHQVKVAITMQALDRNGQIVETVEGETINISASGMALNANFTGERPRFVLLKRDGGGALSLLAAVRGAHEADQTGSMRFHLEFISGKWDF